MKNVTAGRISGEIGFLIFCIIGHIEMFILIDVNSFSPLNLCLNLCYLFMAAFFTVIIFVRSIFLGYLIEEYLINHKVLKEENKKDNII